MAIVLGVACAGQRVAHHRASDERELIAYTCLNAAAFVALGTALAVGHVLLAAC